MGKLLFLFVGALLLAGCTTTSPPSDGTPDWLRQKIAQWGQSPDTSPEAVYRYQYSGQTVYYVRSHCCDQYNYLYDVKGQVICAPNGGLTGRGDGKCSDFEKQATGRELVWQVSKP